MIRNQRKMMTMTTRNSQWEQRQQRPKTKEYQNKGEIFQRTWKFHSTSIKQKKMQSLEKLMFAAEDAPLGFKVGSNHLILKNIMAHLNFSTLKAAREVSKDWKKMANLELGRRKCARFLLWRSQVEILRNSDDISWIEFDWELLDVEQLNDLAAVCGHQVQMLKLEPYDVFRNIPPWKRTLDFLAPEKFPNLEVLCFHKCIIHSTFSRYSRMPSKCKSSADTILPNLQRIEGIFISDALEFPSTFLEDKGHLVKSANLDIRDCAGEDIALNHMTLLAQAKPKLERLKIGKGREGGDLNPEFVKQIDLLLESSRESLRVLDISPSYDSPFYFQPQPLQPYPKLSTFCLDASCFSLKNQLESFNQDCFPNLKTVKLAVTDSIKLYLDNSLCLSPVKRGRLTSVVNLELQCWRMWDSPHDWLPWLATLYPNVRNLTIEVSKDTAEVYHHIFTLWPNLTSLSIQKYCRFSSSVKLDLDPVFTGLSLEKCEELRNHPEKMNMTMIKEILKDRTWPNLNSLKGLKRLDFTITGRISPPFWCPVSLISFLYAINLQPELKTTIWFPGRAIDYRKFLEPLVPYAQLQSYY